MLLDKLSQSTCFFGFSFDFFLGGLEVVGCFLLVATLRSLALFWDMHDEYMVVIGDLPTTAHMAMKRQPC